MTMEVSQKPVMEVRVEQIKVGNRYRKDMGNLDLLVESISQIGLLQPIGIDSNYKLIFGERRLRAFEKLGRNTIPARIVHVPSLLSEHAENEIREDFKPSERDAIREAILAQYKEEERRGRPKQQDEAQTSLLDEPEKSGHLPTISDGEKSRDKAAKLAGFESDRTARRVHEVVTKAEPELIEAMDKGEVAISTAAKLATAPAETQRTAAADPKKAIELAKQASAAKVREIKQTATETATAQREAKKAAIVERLETVAAREVEAPTGLYDVIVIDPPWPMQKIERDVRPNQVEFDYPTMSEDELSALTIPADTDCHIWLWTTHKFMPMAFRLLDAWGLKYVCTFVWHKPGGFQPIGLPQYNCEFALYARKGSPQFIDTKAFPTCFQAPRGAHSEKPEDFYEVIRRVTGGQRLDMFNRREINGFAGWGKEAA